MKAIREAKYQWGQRVLAGIDLVNDGSHPECAADGLLVACGTPGEVIQIGHHVEANVPVYMVEFAPPGRPACVVGCMEEELSLPD